MHRCFLFIIRDYYLLAEQALSYAHTFNAVIKPFAQVSSEIVTLLVGIMFTLGQAPLQPLQKQVRRWFQQEVFLQGLQLCHAY